MTPRSAAELEKEFYDAAMADERLTHYDASIASAGYARGYLNGHSAGHAAGLADTAELHQELANISGWLKRMSVLKWDDETYAPNFKSAHERAEQALARFKAVKGE